jgi:hypothetical protein
LPVYAGSGWNAFSFPAVLPRFIVVRADVQVKTSDGQPVGDSMQILSLFGRFFEARPGHWGGWELETYPQVTQIEFVNAERTKANANVTIGYSGATVVLEKVDGKWRAVRLTNQWIT